MNPTDEYIKMCKKATELQEQWQPSAGDYIGEKGTHRIDMIAPKRLLMVDNITDIKERAFFILRQDQLWEMLPIGTSLKLIIDCQESALYACQVLDGPVFEEYTAEVALLKSVQSSKYSKQWDGKEWIDAEGESE